MIRALRWLAWAAAAGILAAAVVVLATRSRQSSTVTARPRPGELSVPAALGRGAATGIVVRGYVFEGGALGAVICGARTRARPAACTGGLLYLSGLDPSRLNFDEARGRTGALIGWTAQPVAVGGDLRGLTLAVEQLLG